MHILYGCLIGVQFAFAHTYEIKLLDRSNLEQVQQVLQLFTTSPIQSVKNIIMQDLEKWLMKETYNVLLAINKKGLICGVAIYYIANKNQLFLRVIAISPVHQYQGIANKLLHELELVPNIVAIETNMTKEHITFYKLFKKLGYVEIE